MNKPAKLVELQSKYIKDSINHLHFAMNQTKEYYFSTYNRLPDNVVELEVFTEKVIKLIHRVPEEETESLDLKLARLKQTVEQFKDDYKIHVLNSLIRIYEVELICRRTKSEHSEFSQTTQ